MSNITTSTTIPSDIYDKIKRNGWKMNELIRLGVKSKENNPQLLERFKEQENINKNLLFKLTKVAQEKNELILRISKLEQKK